MKPARNAVAGVDVGGTFTDAVVHGAAGPRIAKVPTTGDDQGVGVMQSIASALDDDDPRLSALAHGTTTATNAILERQLDRAVLVVTEGFADLLTIARQDRPSLYDLTQIRPAPAIPRDMVVTVPERITVGGTVLTPLTDHAIEEAVGRIRALEPTAVAICLLFSWADDRHEVALGRAIQAALPDVHLTTSADLVGSIREYERASTCALNAAIGPTMSRYLRRLKDRVDPDTPITVMTSGGGTADVDRMAIEPVHTLLSGPAAGVVAAAEVARRAGHPDAIAFDMGGTSTDVCLIRDGEPVLSVTGTIDGLPIGTSTIGIHTVGAGGGSIAHLDAGGALQVGPRSAGSDPGPACYGRGGTKPTVTDAHAILGHVVDFADGSMRADIDAARTVFDQAEGVTARGVVDVVRAAMARALRRVSTEAGVDPAGLALVAYGGAGPLHASALARMLGCPVTILATAPGVLSAVGLLTAPQRQEWSRTVMCAPEDLPAALDDHRQAILDANPHLEADHDQSPTSEAEGTTKGNSPGRTVRAFADMRYRGQAHELRIPLSGPADPTATGDADDPETAFHRAHKATYGYALDDDPVEVVTIRLVATQPPLHPDAATFEQMGPRTPTETRTADLGQGSESVPIIARATLEVGQTLLGPAILTQPDSTALLLRGDVATVTDTRLLVITHGEADDD